MNAHCVLYLPIPSRKLRTIYAEKFRYPESKNLTLSVELVKKVPIIPLQRKHDCVCNKGKAIELK